MIMPNESDNILLEDTSDPHHAHIIEMRKQARQYIEENKKLVSRLWEIDLKLETPSLVDKAALIEEKADLSRQLRETNYPKKIDDLLEEIKALELEVDGHSDIGSSPYRL
jgi:hypothetical protein